MANTITLAGSINFAQCFLGFKALNIGTSNEPAITAANIVMQTILGNPFIWNWNIGQIAYALPKNWQDVVVPAATYGFIQKAGYLPANAITNTSLTSYVATYTCANAFVAGNPVTIVGTTNGSGALNGINLTVASAGATSFTVAITHANLSSTADTGYAGSGVTSEITNTAAVLGNGTELGSPNYIAPQIDDNAGNITFRVLPSADQNYIVIVTFQNRIPALMSTTSSTWAPIPDHMSYMYQTGFTAWMLAYSLDPRWASFNQKFIASILGAAEGVSEEDKNLFLQTWTDSMNTAQSSGSRRQQGIQGIGSI